MAVNSIASSSAVLQAVPARQPEPSQTVVDRPAERIAAPTPPAPPQAASAPSVNTAGQRIGTTISTSA